MANTVYYNPAADADAVLVLFNCNEVIGTYRIGLHSIIGRASAQSSCDIQINSLLASRMHGEIIRVNDEYRYRDLGSTNGTYVSGAYLGAESGNDYVTLKEGDVIGFGAVRDDEHHPNGVYALFTCAESLLDNWQSILLDNSFAEICIGRSASSGICINNATISEKHASFFNSSGGWAIIDHKSTNGVFLNGKSLSIPKYLEDMSSVRIGNSYFIYTGKKILFSSGTLLDTGFAPSQPETEHTQNTDKLPEVPNAHVHDVKPAESDEPRRPQAQDYNGTPDLIIQIEERSVVQRFKKMTLLQDINISVSNGEMVLILGGSGAGKTTFINAVMGYEKAAGRIVYNNTDIYEEYEQMKYEIGFVPQQDLLRGGDTVLDTLSNAAEMKLPRSISEEKREARIRDVLEQFGLSREKESLVSKLSGGQKKRLSIAIEYIADPSLFFLDEPDSGIDDIMGRGIMENLRSIADLGKIIMVITHSPERAADLFDKVIVLAKSSKDNCGHLAFFGSVDEAFAFFEVSSFRDIVKRINRPDENGEGLSDYYIEKYASVGRGNR